MAQDRDENLQKKFREPGEITRKSESLEAKYKEFGVVQDFFSQWFIYCVKFKFLSKFKICSSMQI